jgi:hypothetical protein
MALPIQSKDASGDEYFMYSGGKNKSIPRSAYEDLGRRTVGANPASLEDYAWVQSKNLWKKIYAGGKATIGQAAPAPKLPNSKSPGGSYGSSSPAAAAPNAPRTTSRSARNMAAGTGGMSRPADSAGAGLAGLEGLIGGGSGGAGMVGMAGGSGSLPIDSAPPEDPITAHTGGSQETGPMALIGPGGLRSGLGSRLPPSLAALLKPRVY